MMRLLLLADYAMKIEAHYSKEAGYQKPMDIEWAKDGVDGLLYIVQARPRLLSQKKLKYIRDCIHLKIRVKYS